MEDQSIEFKGVTNVYLQGNEALEPIGDVNSNVISYFVARPQSGILVNDSRKLAVQAARQALSGADENNFAEVFSQPANIEIRSFKDHVEIDLAESEPADIEWTLWLGVIENHKMAIHRKTFWELLRPVGQSQIAFAALVS